MDTRNLIEKLSNENFGSWSMRAMSIGQDLWEVFETDFQDPVIASSTTTSLKGIGFWEIKDVKESEIDTVLKVSSKFSFNCHYCKEPGHMKRDCYKLKAKSGKNEEDSRKKGHANFCASVVTSSGSQESGTNSGGDLFRDFSF